MFSFWVDVFFCFRERAFPVLHMPKAKSPKIEDGSGTEVIRSNSIAVAASVSRTSSALSHLSVPIQRFIFILWAIVMVGSSYLMPYQTVDKPYFQPSPPRDRPRDRELATSDLVRQLMNPEKEKALKDFCYEEQIL